jgi:hypothetical protein
VTCAQATLYEPRIRQITGLLDRENAHTHTEAIVRPGNDGVLAALPQDADWDAITNAVKKHSSERARAEHTRVQTRIDAITEQADVLRRQLEDHKTYMKSRGARMRIAARRSRVSDKNSQNEGHLLWVRYSSRSRRLPSGLIEYKAGLSTLGHTYADTPPV